MIVHVGGKRTHSRYLLMRQRVEVSYFLWIIFTVLFFLCCCIYLWVFSCVYSFREIKLGRRRSRLGRPQIPAKTSGDITNRTTAALLSLSLSRFQITLQQMLMPRGRIKWSIWIWNQTGYMATLPIIRSDFGFNSKLKNEFVWPSTNTNTNTNTWFSHCLQTAHIFHRNCRESYVDWHSSTVSRTENTLS